MSKTYDIAVIGATPGGLAAASYLARKGLDIILLDVPSQDVESPLAEWAARDFFKLDGMGSGLIRGCNAKEFRRVLYHNIDRDKTVEYKARSPIGYLFQSAELLDVLRKDAADAGVRIRTTKTEPTIELDEDAVRILGTVQVQAKLLLMAASRPHDIIRELALPVRTVPQSSLVIAGLDIPLPTKSVPASLAGMLHVAEMPEQTELGLFFATKSCVHIRVVSDSVASGNRAAELSSLVASLQQAGLVPANLPLGRARGAVWRPPAGVALDLESHVAKRCLLAGTAGGFASSINGHTLYPSAKSAFLACDVLIDALQAEHPQDALMQFKNAWRSPLADYLRPPNTSLHMLLPLLFVNKRIVGKFTRALLAGENI